MSSLKFSDCDQIFNFVLIFNKFLELWYSIYYYYITITITKKNDNDNDSDGDGDGDNNNNNMVNMCCLSIH